MEQLTSCARARVLPLELEGNCCQCAIFQLQMEPRANQSGRNSCRQARRGRPACRRLPVCMHPSSLLSFLSRSCVPAFAGRHFISQSTFHAFFPIRVHASMPLQCFFLSWVAGFRVVVTLILDSFFCVIIVRDRIACHVGSNWCQEY